MLVESNYNQDNVAFKKYVGPFEGLLRAYSEILSIFIKQAYVPNNKIALSIRSLIIV